MKLAVIRALLLGKLGLFLALFLSEVYTQDHSVCTETHCFMSSVLICLVPFA